MTKPQWLLPKTSRAYLHPVYSNRVVTVHPDMKICDLELDFTERHTRQDGFGLHILAGTELEALDFRTAAFDEMKDGLPVYTVRNTDPENGCCVSMTAFCDSKERPYTYLRITVKNPSCTAVSGKLGIMCRTAINKDNYLTGLWDTGYESYQPNYKQWLLLRDPVMISKDGLNVDCESGYGHMKIISSSGFDVSWISREEQRHRMKANDVTKLDYALDAGQNAVVDIVMCVDKITEYFPFDTAYENAVNYWKSYLDRVTLYPVTDSSKIKNMYLANVTQCLQMIARYNECSYTFTRQGDVGRFVWVWEGVHVLSALDRLGFHEITRDAYLTYTREWLCLDGGENNGKITYPYVLWDNAEGAAVRGISKHLQYVNNKSEFELFKPYLDALMGYIRRRREQGDNDGTPYKGLYPAGKASDWGEIGKHWTFTDADIVNGLSEMVKVYEMYNADNKGEVKEFYEQYNKSIYDVMAQLYKGHENDEEFILPHIAGVSFEESYNHCFYTDGAPYLILLGFLKPNSRMFEQMEAFFKNNGLFENNLAGRITNATDPGVGAYGDVYYTGVADFCWIYAYMARGEKDKLEPMVKALYDYNLTPEYVVCERYCSTDPYYTPWQPNGSGSARIVNFLLDYYK